MGLAILLEEVFGTEKKALGIIGGMGPEATLDLFGKLLHHTDAKTDAEHIRIYLDCHAGIPDRTRAILAGGESPVPYIAESAQKLASIGAELLLIPCNTSHYYYEEICRLSPVPVMNMIRETAQHLQREGATCVAVLATDGTVQSGVYQTELAVHGIRALCPAPAAQQEVMRLIYEGVKAGAPAFSSPVLEAELQELRRQGASHVVLGCTELPIGFAQYGIACPHAVDATDVLARAAVLAAGYPLKV